jgi:glyoxylase I family protein
MNVAGLNHINIAAMPSTIERVRAFYIEVLGLAEGDRPPLRSPGHWLYAGGDPIVHLSIRDSDAGESGAMSGSIDHFALTCHGLSETLGRLARLGVAHHAVEVPGREQVQIFLRDPAGVKLELNFSGEALPGVNRPSAS